MVHFSTASRMLLCLAMAGTVTAKAATQKMMFNDEDGGLSDPLWKKTWYLLPSTKPSLRVFEAWKAGYSGKGVVVTVMDDGLKHTHPDLINNYDKAASYDFNDNDQDPLPRGSYENTHGTKMAGMIAASANNSVCSLGVAWGAKIGGIRMLDGEVTDLVEAKAIAFNIQHIDVYVAAYGPDDDGRTVEGPALQMKQAMRDGNNHGRRGKGSIYVWGTGHGGRYEDDCSCDGYASNKYVIAINSVDDEGNIPWYGERCPSILATAYAGKGLTSGKNMVTTYVNGRCTENYNGNGASSSIAAGICALTLEANPDLTWRDIQHLIVDTANPAGLVSDDWITNGAKLKVSRTFGFGLMDALAMVKKAEKWKGVPQQETCTLRVYPGDSETWNFTQHSTLNVSIRVESCDGDGVLPDSLEHVEVVISTSTMPRRGDLAISLTSAMGTKTTLLDFRPRDYKFDRFSKWPFTTVQNWNENPAGIWNLAFARKSPGGSLEAPVELIFYGTVKGDQEPPEVFMNASQTRGANDSSTADGSTRQFLDQLKNDFTHIFCVTACRIRTLLERDKEPCVCPRSDR